MFQKIFLVLLISTLAGCGFFSSGGDAQQSDQIANNSVDGWVESLAPLGPEGSIDALLQAQKDGVLSKMDVAKLIASPVGTQLAEKFNMSPLKFRAQAYAAGISEMAADIFEDVKGKVQDAAQKAYSAAQSGAEQLSQKAQAGIDRATEVSSEKYASFKEWLENNK